MLSARGAPPSPTARGVRIRELREYRDYREYGPGRSYDTCHAKPVIALSTGRNRSGRRSGHEQHTRLPRHDRRRGRPGRPDPRQAGRPRARSAQNLRPRRRRGLPGPDGRPRRGRRLPGTERRRQVHHPRRRPRLHPPRRRHRRRPGRRPAGGGAGRTRRRGPPGRWAQPLLHGAPDPRHHRLPPAAHTRHRIGDRPDQTGGAAPQEDLPVLRRRDPARSPGAGAPGPARAAGPGRADHRHGPDRPRRLLGDDAAGDGAGPGDPLRHPLSAGGRRRRRPHHHHRPRPPGRRGIGGRGTGAGRGHHGDRDLAGSER